MTEEELLALMAMRPAAPSVTVHPPHVTVLGDAADAARLYGQLLEKARAEVRASVRVANTDIECVIHQQLDNLQDEKVYVALINWKGRKLEARVRIPARQDNLMDTFQKLADETAKVIAVEILRPLFSKVHFDRFK